MKIVLIGARGFLGNALWKGIQEQYPGIEWHLFTSSNTLEQPLAENCHMYNYRWPQDSLAGDTYAPVLLFADVIIYAAGAGIQPGENADESSIYHLNLFEPAKLAHLLIKSNYTGQLITFGSYFETGNVQPPYPLNEQQFLEQSNPLPNVYCRSKKELSHFHFVNEQAGISFKWLHLILTNIYGPGENEKRLIPYIIQQSRQKAPLHFTKGSQVRQYTFIGDVVHVTTQLLGKATGMYQVTHEETLSVKTVIEETVQQVRDHLSISPELYYDLAERRDTSMDYLAVNAQKLLTEWKLACSTTFKEGIAHYFKQ